MTEPQLCIIDTGGPLVTVSLLYPDGMEVSCKVEPDQAEGKRCRDLIAAMRRRAEGGT